jgi:proteic killer suppression protein
LKADFFPAFEIGWRLNDDDSFKKVDTVTKNATIGIVIKSFKHRGLVELFELGRSRRVRQELQSRCLRRLEALDQAESLTDLLVPGFNLHGLQGTPKRFSIHVNGPWCVTFKWEEGEALRVDLVQYH